MSTYDSAKACPTCDGKGTILKPVQGTDFISDKYFLDTECPACKGTGTKHT